MAPKTSRYIGRFWRDPGRPPLLPQPDDGEALNDDVSAARVAVRRGVTNAQQREYPLFEDPGGRGGYETG